MVKHYRWLNSGVCILKSGMWINKLACRYFKQTLMSALRTLNLVMRMPLVKTILEASPVPVTKVTLGMDLNVMVSICILLNIYQITFILLFIYLKKNYLLDIDECFEENDNCDNNANCENTDGGFTCTCKTGYRGNGVTCDGMHHLTTFINVIINLNPANYHNVIL